jgi:glucose-6-phosphate isomerase
MWSLKSVHGFDRSEMNPLVSQSKLSLDALLAREDLGFFNVLAHSSIWAATSERANFLRTHYDTMVVLGIGGSSLGGIALLEGLKDRVDRRVEFFDNVDSHRFAERFTKRRDWKRAHYVIISKSGNTIETLNIASLMSQILKDEDQVLFTDHCTVVTENKKNPLMNWATDNKVPALELAQSIGGRFSVFSPVGLLPALFSGLNAEELQSGIALALNQKELIAQLAAHTLQSFKNEKWITVFWPYCDDLKEFGQWAIQLWAESLAKTQDRNQKPAPRASTPVNYLGATDQHSVLQQVAEGARDKFVMFMRVDKAESSGTLLKKSLFPEETSIEGRGLGELLKAEAQATIESLWEKYKVPSVVLNVSLIDEKSLSELMMIWMLVVGTLGEAMNIDAFNQPGVEAGKIRAKQILKS